MGDGETSIYLSVLNLSVLFYLSLFIYLPTALPLLIIKEEEERVKTREEKKRKKRTCLVLEMPYLELFHIE